MSKLDNFSLLPENHIGNPDKAIQLLDTIIYNSNKTLFKKDVFKTIGYITQYPDFHGKYEKSTLGKYLAKILSKDMQYLVDRASLMKEERQEMWNFHFFLS